MTTTTATLASELAKLSPAKRIHIRRLYNAVSDAMLPLALALEDADCDTGCNAGPLLEEHMLFIEMLEVLKRSELGKVL